MWLDYFMYFTYAIFFVAVGMTFFFAFKGMFSDIKSSIIPLVAVLGLIVLFVFFWAITDGQEVKSSAGVVLATAGQSHFVSAGLNIFYIMFGATILAAVYSAISSAFKNK